MVTLVSEDSSVQRLVSSVAASKEIIIGLCVLALGERTRPHALEDTLRPCLICPPVLSPSVLSMILMMIIRYISAVLVWILTSLVVLGSLGEVTSCLQLTAGGLS